VLFDGKIVFLHQILSCSANGKRVYFVLAGNTFAKKSR